MKREDIIAMAREALDYDYSTAAHWWGDAEQLEHFAVLVADAEAKRIHDEGMVTVGHMREQIAAATEEANRRANASWALMCEKMVAAEREACAKVCESEWSNTAERMYGEECAAAIRARGQA